MKNTEGPKPPKRNPIAADLRTPKYRKRVVPDKKKQENKNKCRRKDDEPFGG